MSQKVSKPEIKTEAPSVTPFGIKHIVTVTELAHYGLEYLKLILPTAEEQFKKGTGNVTETGLKHLRGLVNVSGPESIGHFQLICKADIDKQVAMLKAGSTEKSKEA